ncbi:MAG TPA: ABC transporter permease, partial [Actinomycetota bacterium]|nr:ABC transporter permease [Actinomycetota bacterium]
MSQVAPDVLIAPGDAITAAGEPRARSPRELFWTRFKADRPALVGLGFIVFLVVLGLAAPVIADLVGHGPNDRFQRDMTDPFGLPLGPNSEFWFGADLAGRDLFVRVIYGIRTSLVVAVVATGIAFFIGVTLGMAAGYFGGRVDTVISRFTDIILSMPLLLFAIGLVSACSTTAEGCLGGLAKPGLRLVIFIIALFSWPAIARIVRGNTLSLREREFVEASKSLGASNGWVLTREILPNLTAPIIVYATLVIPNNIIFEASLSFLGLGVPQSVPSWGRMLSDAAGIFEVAWWLMLFPGLFLVLTTLAFNLVGDGLR